MAVNQHRIDDFAVPFGGVELGFRENSVHVVLLEIGPLGGQTAAYEVTPANGFLGANKDGITFRQRREFVEGEGVGVEVRSHAGKEYAY